MLRPITIDLTPYTSLKHFEDCVELEAALESLRQEKEDAERRAQKEVKELRAIAERLEFENSVLVDQARIDTRADPKPCRHCGSVDQQTLCVNCGRAVC